MLVQGLQLVLEQVSPLPLLQNGEQPLTATVVTTVMVMAMMVMVVVVAVVVVVVVVDVNVARSQCSWWQRWQ